MNWLESLEELIDKETLDKYNKIFYLNSIVAIPETQIDEIVEDNKLSQLLSQEEPDATTDILDFFLLENEVVRDVMIILSPHELMEDESFFKTYPNIEEDFSNLDSLEQIK
ncbi:hypothetical protein [Moheibacter sediminis]|uniref:Uncharacterized protein n=1 Tax=Moheibacter sediminis TaxID=1434700 RepID=A0A1W1YNH6_9FLAO|nr:hypothetical protein [Moheibacter sediminis]SMC37686.1 hypothetical protein SAMN06296427_101578 [Moheibacter sediminis]